MMVRLTMMPPPRERCMNLSTSPRCEGNLAGQVSLSDAGDSDRAILSCSGSDCSCGYMNISSHLCLLLRHTSFALSPEYQDWYHEQYPNQDIGCEREKPAYKSGLLGRC